MVSTQNAPLTLPSFLHSFPHRQTGPTSGTILPRHPPMIPAAFAPWNFIRTRNFPSRRWVRRRRSATSSLYAPFPRPLPPPTVPISPDTAPFFFCFSFYCELHTDGASAASHWRHLSWETSATRRPTNAFNVPGNGKREVETDVQTPNTYCRTQTVKRSCTW